MAVRASRTDATTVVTSDAAVKAGPGWVFWIAASAGATGGAFQISDALDDSNDVFDITMPATSVMFFGPFDPPIRCDTGIYADIPGTNVTLTVGYQ